MATQSTTTPRGVTEPVRLQRPTVFRRRNTLPELIERERIRTKIEAAVARLIDALDVIDGDPDLEDSHDAEAVNEDGGDINDEPHDEEWRDVA